MTEEAQQRAAGKAVAVDNGGKPTTVITKRIEILPTGELAVGVLEDSYNNTIDLNLDAEGGQAPWSRGQIEILADVGAIPGNVDWLYSEVNVIGMIGGARSVIARLAFGAGKSVGRVPLRDPYDKIAFEARQVVSNLVEGPTPQAASLGYLVVARLYR